MYLLGEIRVGNPALFQQQLQKGFPMGRWFGWSNSTDRSGLNTKVSAKIDKDGNPYDKHETLNGNDANHDHAFVRHTHSGPAYDRHITTETGASTKGSGHSGWSSGRDRDAGKEDR